MSIRVLCGNVLAHYMDDTEGTPLPDRIATIVALIRTHGDIFLASEVNPAPGQYILDHLQAVDADWDYVQGEKSNALFYRPSMYQWVGLNNFALASDKRLNDFTMIDIVSGQQFHAMVTHLIVDSASGRKTEATQIAAYARQFDNAFLGGDFNEYGTAPDSVKGILAARADLHSIQPGAVNADKDSWDGGSTGQWIDDILVKSSTGVSGAALVPTSGGSDHWGWVKAELAVSAAAGDLNGTYVTSVRRTGDSLHLIDANGDETVCVPAGPNLWVPTTSAATHDPGSPGDPDTPGDTGTQSRLIGWHKARLGDFDYSQSSGRLNPDASGHTDCSGLQYACYKSVMGINIGTNSRDQADGNHGGTTITTTRSAILAGTGMQRGDLIFYAHPGETWSHVEMYYGGSQVIGISNPHEDGPRIQPLSLQVNYFQGSLKVKRYT